MSGAGKTNGGRSLQELEALLPKAVFIPIPLGEKKPVDNGWQRTTFEQSQSPQYKARLREGNIGVLLGQPGGNLCAIDIDDDQEIQRFIDLNPQLTCTLCSAGARGCQIWVVVKGSYPHRIYKLQTTNHKKWGEWRADGGQSVICGLHPSGCTYRLLCDQPPITIRFEEIVWPEYLLKPWLAQTPQPAAITPKARPGVLQLTERIRRYMAALPPSVDGHQGDERLFKAADKLVNGFALEPGEALSFLREYNNRAEPPWPESRLIYKLNEALEHPLETRSRGYLLDAEKSYGTEPKEPAFYSQLKEDFANTRTNCQEPPLPAQDLPAHQSSSYQGQHISPSTQIVRELGIYYDHYRKDYWVNNDRGGWIMVGATDVKRRLAEKGFREKPLKNENISQIDSFLTTIQNSCDVDYAGSLAGYDRGIHEVGGHRILVKDSPELISPVPGSWPLLEGIIKRMLGLEGQTYLFGWLKVALESLYSRKFRPGQALALVGPKDCGKSLLQNHVITPLLGNRCAKPHRYMSGLTPFNSDLFAAEHLVIEDEQASTDIRARRNFGEKIKEVTANEHQSCHAKNRTAITLSPFWRLSITLNDEPENLLILPPMDDSVQDKLTILKAEKYPMPHPTVTNQEREAFIEALTAELPHFVHFLLNWPIPEHLQSHRYGIAHYQHPEILEALTSSTPETELLELINAELFSLSSASEWSGTASKLQQYLTRNDSDVRRQAERLLSWTGACGTYLGRLKKRFPARFEYQHTRTDRIWVVRPPE